MELATKLAEGQKAGHVFEVLWHVMLCFPYPTRPKNPKRPRPVFQYRVSSKSEHCLPTLISTDAI